MSSIIVNGMHCQHCTAAVTKAMSSVPEAGDVKVDLASGKAEWTGSASVEAMSSAVEDQGYEVKKS